VYSRLDLGLRQSTAYAPDWRPRYGEAYRRQDKAFLQFVRTGAFSPIAANSWDGYCAACVAAAGVKSLAEGAKVAIECAAMPKLYET
jgi:myo-inositol 2-dehydrogenase / D-chiro-inositol 1-dehydrogenase